MFSMAGSGWGVAVVVSTFDGKSFVRFYYVLADRQMGRETDYDYKVQLLRPKAPDC